MRGMALGGGSAWGSRTMPAARPTWTASGRADSTTVLVAGEDLQCTCARPYLSCHGGCSSWRASTSVCDEKVAKAALMLPKAFKIWCQLVVHLTGEAGVEGADRAEVAEAAGEGLAEGLEGAGEALAVLGEGV